MRRIGFGLFLAACTVLNLAGCPQLLPFSNDNPLVSLSSEEVQIAEDGGVAVVTASLDAPTHRPVTVALIFSGSATSGKDYTRSAMTITIPAFQSAGTVRLTGVTDVTADGDRTIIVDIASITNGTEDGEQQVTLNVIDNDPAATVTLTLPGGTQETPLVTQGTISEPDEEVVVTAKLSNPARDDVTVNLAVTGTATKDADYTLTDTKIVILAGDTEGSITVKAMKDTGFDQGETIIIDIDSVTNAAEVVTDNKGQQVTLSILIAANTPAENKAKGEAFLAANATQPGVVVLPSGLQYKIIKVGTGAKPIASSTISVKYRGTLIDGTQFDSSNGQAVTFPLSNLIDGWQEALLLMPVGSQWMLYVPASLGYGDQPNGQIPASSTLIFDIELVEIL